MTKTSNESGGTNSLDLDSPDNVDWTRATTLDGVTDYSGGLIFVNEDNSSGEIWQINPDGSIPMRIANTTVSGESTGIFDLSELVGYAPGSILISNNQGTPASMTVLINGDAELAVPRGAGNVAGLRVDRLDDTDLQLDWQPSCSEDDDDYAVYVGQLGQYDSHTAQLCSTAGSTTATLPLPAGAVYVLVVAVDGAEEGSYGKSSNGVERVVGAAACATQTVTSPCP